MSARVALPPAILALALLTMPGSAQEPPHAQTDKNTGSDAALSATLASQNTTWQDFLNTTGGEWTSRWCTATATPRMVFGSGIQIANWRGNSLEEARRHAHAFLREHEDLLGLGASDFREIIGSRMGRTWCFVFDQYFRGLPVIDGRADVRVHMVGRIPAFGSTAFDIPANFVTVPQLSELAARQIAWSALDQAPPPVTQPGEPRQPRLVIWGDVHAKERAPVHLAWEIPISAVDAEGNGPIGRYYVDANSGALLHYASDKHECGFANCRLHDAPRLPARPLPARPLPARPLPAPQLPSATGTVMAWTRLGTSAVAAPVNVPLAGVEVSVPGIGTVVTDENGQFTASITANTAVTVTLDGIHTQLVAGTSAPSDTQTLIAGGSTTFQLLNNNPNANQTAHTTTYYWIDRVNEWCRTIFGNSPELDITDDVVPTVNISSTCNAYYTNNTVNFYRAGGGCNNSAFSSVIAHEWGHGLDDVYGGISQTNGLSEGWADILSLYLLDNALVGEDLKVSGGFVRTGANTRQYPTGNGVHAQGESWMGFAWKLREELEITQGTRAAAIAITEAIVVGSIVADATSQADAVVEVFIADDDDGDLTNGTPHSPELIHACNLHSLPYPGGGPVSPVNDDCANVISLTNGINGPYTNVGALTSSPAWPCANGGADVWFTYFANVPGTLQVQTCGQALWDTCMEIFAGDCGSLTSLACNDDSCNLRSSVSIQVTPGTYYIRVGGYNSSTGPFSLDVSGPVGAPASSTRYGVGCYRESKAFYELTDANSFDLNGVSMQLTRTGDYYVASAAGTYVAPSASATPVTLTDDDEATVNLNGSFPFPGGTTTSLTVCSNGFVSVATGNGIAYTPNVATWLGSVEPRWGTHHDFNPAANGSGSVMFEQVGSIAYVTWDGVYDYNATTPNFWQLQFDLSTGNVTYAWQSLSGIGSEVLIGYAHFAPNENVGSMDISAELPNTFSTSPDNVLGLTLDSNLPQIGTNLTFTTSEYPQGTLLGVQILSLTQYNPGIDLGPFGMPECFRYTELDVTIFLFPTGGQSTFSLAVPNDLAYIGLPINGQSYAMTPGANLLGVVSSNGIATVVGL